ncbi:MAG: rod-binding protein [Desulfovermiculus sp.]
MSLAVDPQLHLPGIDPSAQNSDMQLRAACEKFEAFFVQAMFKSMRKTIPEGGLIERNNGQKWFEEFMDAELAESMAGESSIGIAQALYQEISGVSEAGKQNGVSPGSNIQTKG